MTQPTSSQPSRIVIIGASLAGGSAAIALRDHGYQGELTVIGEESQLPYERPPLSKAVLIGNTDEPDWVGDEATYADKNISLRLGTMATRIDRTRKVVVASRTEYPYDKLLIATGSAPHPTSLSRTRPALSSRLAGSRSTQRYAAPIPTSTLRAT